jgi:hypothetical protein
MYRIHSLFPGNRRKYFWLSNSVFFDDDISWLIEFNFHRFQPLFFFFNCWEKIFEGVVFAANLVDGSLKIVDG